MAGGVSTLCLCSRSCFPACPSVFEGTLAKAVEAQVHPKHSSPQISASLKTHRPRAGELLLAWPALPERLCWGSFLQGLPQVPREQRCARSHLAFLPRFVLADFGLFPGSSLDAASTSFRTSLCCGRPLFFAWSPPAAAPVRRGGFALGWGHVLGRDPAWWPHGPANSPCLCCLQEQLPGRLHPPRHEDPPAGAGNPHPGVPG